MKSRVMAWCSEAGGGADGDFDLPHFRGAEAVRAGAVEFLHVGAGLVEPELAVLGDDLAARAADFQAVSAGGFAGAGDEVADRAVGVFQRGGDFVFDFDGVGLADETDGGDAVGHQAVDDELDEIEVVRALVDEYAAAFAAPGRPPAARGVVGPGAKPVGDQPGDAGDFAEFAGLHKLAEFLIHGIAALVEHDAEFEVGVLLEGGFIGVGAGAGGFDGDGQGLFHEDVEAGGRRRRRRWAMWS